MCVRLIQCLYFFACGKHSDGVSAIRFKMMVAVRGLIFRLVERVARWLTTCVAICSNDLFGLFDSSRRRRKSITCAFNSFICIKQFRNFWAWRFWMPITLFNCKRKCFFYLFLWNICEFLPFAWQFSVFVAFECSCFGTDQQVWLMVFELIGTNNRIAKTNRTLALTNLMNLMTYLANLNCFPIKIQFQWVK